jgi:hypothetical protein
MGILSLMWRRTQAAPLSRKQNYISTSLYVD